MRSTIKAKKSPVIQYRCKECDYPLGYKIIGRCPHCGKFDTCISQEQPSDLDQYKEFDFQMDLFMYVWKNREHKSQISGRKLDEFYGTDFFPNLFEHVLPTGVYKKMKYRDEDILLLHPDESNIITRGTLAEQKEYEKQWNCSFTVYSKLKAILIENYRQRKFVNKEEK